MRAFTPLNWALLFVSAGLALRAFHYLRNPSVWYDEAALLVNVLERSFRELLGPLLWHEAGPPLFLWMERTLALCLGDSTYVLRLAPFIAACLTLLLLLTVARRTLPAEVVPGAVFLVAFSDRLLWHGSEAKPYAVDAFVAVAVLALDLAMRGWPLARQMTVWTLLAPFFLWLSYPACFVLGGLLTVLLVETWQSREQRAWLGFAILFCATALAFLLLYFGPIRAQRCAAMMSCWTDQFAPWHRPWKLPLWTVCSTLDVARYCFEPTGHALGVLAAVGAYTLWRSGQWRIVVLGGLPGVLALLAAYAHAYPFGGARVAVFWAPALALFAAAGLPRTWSWLAARARLAPWALAALLAAPLLVSAYRVVVFWPRADCASAARFVLAHRAAADPVLAHDWEYRYYFRQLARDRFPLDDRLPALESRVWLVRGGIHPERETPLGGAFPTSAWRVALHRDFFRASVDLLVHRKDQIERSALSPSGF